MLGHRSTPAFLALSVSVLAVVLYFKSRQDETQEIKKRIARLEEQVGKARKETPSYRPKNAGRIDNLSYSAEDILRQIPGIADVEVAVPAKNPTHRIVHIRDWHHVSKELFALD